MKKTYFTKFQIKDKTARHELARAHGMIVLLVIALMGVLVLSNVLAVALDPVLTFIAVFLLAIVGVISLSVVVVLTKRR